jgi:hypothetical protein
VSLLYRKSIALSKNPLPDCSIETANISTLIL